MSAENHHVVVSILTPAYNAESYIGEAISSALAQTFPAFELIVVDDGSTDRTSAVAEEYARRDARVHVIRQTNGGTAKARNTAISASRGDYLALLDSDDRWMPDFLEVTLTTLSTHPELDVVSANAINFGAERDGTPWKPVFDGLKPVSLRDIIAVEDSICVAAMFRRRVAESVGGFDETLTRNEDYDFWLRAAGAGYSFAFDGRPAAWYRRRPGSKSADEHQALCGAVRVLRKAQRMWADRPQELAAIALQIAKLEHRRLVAAAKAALLDKDFDTAARTFRELERHSGGALYYRLLSNLTRHAPGLLLWAYERKSSIAPHLPLFQGRH